jgi:hypothetical protein
VSCQKLSELWLILALTTRREQQRVPGSCTHPSRFTAVGSRLESPGHISRTLLVSTEVYPSSEVVLRSARLRIRENTSQATVRLVLCADTLEHGAYEGTAAQHCGRVIPISGGQLVPLARNGQQLMAEVTPHRPGIVQLDGVDVRYRSGLRWGSESSGWIIRVVTRA